jgi:hypothetical protein
MGDVVPEPVYRTIAEDLRSKKVPSRREER